MQIRLKLANLQIKEELNCKTMTQYFAICKSYCSYYE